MEEAKCFHLCARHHSHWPEVNSNVGLPRSEAEGKPHSGELRVRKNSPFVEMGGVFFPLLIARGPCDVSGPRGEDNSIPLWGKSGVRFSVMLKRKKNAWSKECVAVMFECTVLVCFGRL